MTIKKPLYFFNVKSNDLLEIFMKINFMCYSDGKMKYKTLKYLSTVKMLICIYLKIIY